MSQTGKRSVTVAGVDCGTNSIRLMVTRFFDDGTYEILLPRVMRVVRLGENIDETQRFSEAALQRTFEAIDEFEVMLADYDVDAIRFVATSATRDARNRSEFEDYVEQHLGVRPDVISGKEEARLSFLGALSVIEKNKNAQPPFMVIDLGGGSTELVLGGDGVHTPADQVASAFSMNIGSVRMSERHKLIDSPTQESIDEAIEDIDAHIDKAFREVPAGLTRTIVGVSGTVTTMSAVALGQQEYDRDAVDGAVLNIDAVTAVNNRVVRMSRAERAELGVIHPGRLDVIGGGALVLTRVLERIRHESVKQTVLADNDGGNTADSAPITTFIASEHGLLDGIVKDLGLRLLQS